MKNLLLKLAIVVLFFVFFSGCQKDDNNNTKSIISKNVTNLKPNYVYNDTTTVHKNSTINSNGFRTLATDQPHVNFGVTYLGNSSYQISCQLSKSSNDYIEFTINGPSITYGPNGNYFIATDVLNTSVYSETITLQPGTYNISANVYGKNAYQTQNLVVVTEPTAPTGTVHLLRYVNRTTGFHFYTTDWQELASESNQYVYEMVQGYVYPTSSSDPNTTAIYRYYNSSNSDHLYSHTYSTPSGYVYEGITGYCLTGSSGNFNRALNRLFSPSTGEHFYACPPESPSGFNLEGTVGYIQ